MMILSIDLESANLIRFTSRLTANRRSLFDATRLSLAIIVGFACIFLSGCGKDTTLHPISGKVTLGGKAYPRFLVYFRPVKGEVDQYNLGVGETDATGKLTLRSTAGNGLIAGEYRVSFSHLVVPGSEEAVDPNVKHDRRQDRPPVEKVPEKYADAEQSPVMFKVTSGGSNYFEFDVPGNAT